MADFNSKSAAAERRHHAELWMLSDSQGAQRCATEQRCHLLVGDGIIHKMASFHLGSNASNSKAERYRRTFQSQLNTVSKPVRGRTTLTGVLPSDRVVMLMDVLILSQDEEEREGGEGLLFSTSCLCRKSRHARWMLHVGDGTRNMT